MRKKLILTLLSLPLLAIAAAHAIIEISTSGKTYTDTDKIEQRKVALVLGTSKYLSNGQVNLYFKYRVEAAVKLYQAGKADYILVSGDNSREDYNEPAAFKDALVKQGIPESNIYLDYAGFRTLDSVVRARDIFSQKKITIVSQEFHNERAIFLANRHGVDAIGFNASGVNGQAGFKVKLREYLARAKVFYDLIFGVDPKFGGEKIKIG